MFVGLCYKRQTEVAKNGSLLESANKTLNYLRISKCIIKAWWRFLSKRTARYTDNYMRYWGTNITQYFLLRSIVVLLSNDILLAQEKKGTT